jgi:Fe2+ or Zn2+ uptake regulation protein
MTTDTEITKTLSAHGIRPSIQRLQIYRFLYENRIHPTVDEIFSSIHESIPMLSRMTVYNTINLFAEKGIVQTLNIENNELRYDIDTGFHGHFRCEQCGKVYDVMNLPALPRLSGLKGFKVDHQHLYFMGTCKNCRTNSKTSNT